MKTFEKTYIGKGKQIQNFSIVKISFKLADILKLTHEYNGEEFLTFEVAKMKDADKFGNQYTAYVNKLVETALPNPSQANEPDPAVKKTRKPKKAAASTQVPKDELPF